MSSSPSKDMPHAPEGVLKGVTEGVKLQHVEPEVKSALPSKAEWAEVKETKQAHLTGIEGFDKDKLDHTQPEEKSVLPDKTEWTEVKEQKAAHLTGIERFSKEAMQHVETEVKRAAPTAEEIARDQGIKKDYMSVKEAAANYDKSLLKHTETKVKTTPVVTE